MEICHIQQLWVVKGLKGKKNRKRKENGIIKKRERETKLGDNKKTVNQKFNSIKVEIWPKLIRLRDFVGRMITDFPARAESMATIKYYHGLKFPLITLIREITKKRKESPKHLRNGLFPYILWIAELTAKDQTEAVPTLNFVWFVFIVSPGEKLNQGTRSRSIN